MKNERFYVDYKNSQKHKYDRYGKSNTSITVSEGDEQ